jgi:hypothetical protein
MDNFNLKKYLVENRLTKSNQLNEVKTTGQISDEIEELDNIKRRYEEKGDFDRAAKIEDKIENLKSEFTNRINEIGTPEQEKIKKVVDHYVNLRKAIDSPNYPDTPHTYATMKKVENILQQMSRKENYRIYLLKILPLQYQDFLK